MMNCEKLLTQPIKCRRLLGLTPSTFSILLSQVKIEIERLKCLHPLSKRGRKCKLSLTEQLTLSLLYLRQYATFLDLAERFDISESYAQKRYVYMRKILINICHVEGESELKKKAWSGDFAIDVSEQPMERPQQNQRAYYSGKKKTYP